VWREERKGLLDFRGRKNRNLAHPPSPTLSSTPPDDFINPSASMVAPKTAYEEPAPTSKSANQLPPAPWDVPSPDVLPPPPSRYNQRQKFFKESPVYGGGPSNSHCGSGSYDGVVDQIQNLSIKSPASSTKQEKPEDAIFKGPVDFAKAKSSSPKPNRPS